MPGQKSDRKSEETGFLCRLPVNMGQMKHMLQDKLLCILNYAQACAGGETESLYIAVNRAYNSGIIGIRWAITRYNNRFAVIIP